MKLKLLAVVCLCFTTLGMHAQSGVCSIPTIGPNVPTAPAIRSGITSCTQLPNVTAVVGDGATITDFRMGAPVIMQYCNSAGVCAAPVLLLTIPGVVKSTNPTLVNPANMGLFAGTSGTLYIQQSTRPLTVLYTDASGPQTMTVPVAPTGS